MAPVEPRRPCPRPSRTDPQLDLGLPARWPPSRGVKGRRELGVAEVGDLSDLAPPTSHYCPTRTAAIPLQVDPARTPPYVPSGVLHVPRFDRPRPVGGRPRLRGRPRLVRLAPVARAGPDRPVQGDRPAQGMA